MSSVESNFWHSSVSFFPIYLRKDLILSKPQTRGVDLVFRRDFCVSSGASRVQEVIMVVSRDGGIERRYFMHLQGHHEYGASS